MDELRESLSLITVESCARCTRPSPATGTEIRQHCLQLLEPCILGDKDAILPALGRSGPGETLFIVVSADEHGARVVANRIREQLERSERLTRHCVFKLSSVGLKLPPGEA